MELSTNFLGNFVSYKKTNIACHQKIFENQNEFINSEPIDSQNDMGFGVLSDC